MDISYEDEQNKYCFKVAHKIYGNLNISYYNESSALTVLWNVYQIFVYDDLKLVSPTVFVPEFNIANVIVCNNYLVCLDDNGNIHLTPLKFKQHAQKRLKSSFQPKEQGIKCIKNFYENTICVKYVSNIFYLCVHKVSTDFKLDTENKIIFDKLSLPQPEKKGFAPWIFYTYSTISSEYNQIKGYYEQKEAWKGHSIIFLSSDRINLYSFLYSRQTNGESLYPIKLYTCPSEITSVYVINTGNVSVIISLAIGTLIKISINNLKNDINIIHLNTGIYKLFPIEHCMVYTDGNSMWKSEDTFTDCIKFRKCLLAQIKDFVIVRDKLLCTTFSNLIYLFPINGDLFQDLPQDKYCLASEVLSNNDCLQRIMNEVSKSNEIVQKIRKEEQYLTVLSLSNRYDILDDVIDYNVGVFETFNEVPKDDLILVENIQNYYSQDTFCFVINVSLKPLVSKFTELLSNMFGNLTIHIILSSRARCIKTLSINIVGQMKKVKLAVPISTQEFNNSSRLTVEIKLITSITDVFDTQNVWTVLHSKKMNLTSEHFIKSKVPEDLYFAIDKELDDPIYHSAVCNFGHLYKFNKNKRLNTEWLLYAKLTDTFKEIVNNETYLRTLFSATKSDILLKQITSDDFLKSKGEVPLEIGNDKVILKIINDGFSKPILEVRCTNIEKAYNIRNFLSQLLFNNFIEFEPECKFVDHGLYSKIEKFQRTIHDTINGQHYSNQDFRKIFEKYQRNVIGRMPI